MGRGSCPVTRRRGNAHGPLFAGGLLGWSSHVRHHYQLWPRCEPGVPRTTWRRGHSRGAPCQAARHCAAASNATGCRSAATGTRSRAARFSILRQGARCYRSGTLCFLVIKDAIMTIPASIINTVTNNLAWHTRAIHTPAILMPPTATTAIVKTPPRPRPEPTTRKLSPPPSRRCEPNGARPCVLRRPSPCMLRETTYPL
jgi:hypothetical protein